MPKAAPRHRPNFPAARRYCPPEAKPQSSTARGYGYRWQQYRKQFLSVHPLCVQCQVDGRVTGATVVDHITPHKGNQTLFWGPSNHQSLCKPCHDRKTAAEDGGFGNARRAHTKRR